MQSNRYYYRIFLIITDFVLLDLSCKLAYYLRFAHYEYEYFYASFFIIYSLAWLGSAMFNKTYELEHIFSFKSFLKRLLFTISTHLLIICLYIVSFKAYYYSRLFLVAAYTSSLLSIVFFRYMMSMVYRYYRRASYSMRKIVVVGTGETATSLFNFFETQDTAVYRFMGNFELLAENYYLQAQLEELKQFCIDEKVNELYLTLPNSSGKLVDDIANFADQNFIYFRIITNFDILQRKDIKVELFGGVPIVNFRKEPLKSLGNRMMKRAFDLVFSIAVILLIFPIVFPLVALLIKLDSPGPVLFKQERSGRRNKQFLCYKFRTMRVNEHSDSAQAKKDDKRITQLGAFLRKSSIDELPQFFNVLKGNMSVVGPRPHMLKHTEEYSKIIEKFLVRHFVTPGITGHAQINGFRGGTEDPRLMERRVEYDTWYLQNWSLMLDIKIVFLTVWNMLAGERNAY